MDTRAVGTTGLRISAVGLAAVAEALENGVNWLDTAEAYYERRNETFIGQVLGEVGDEVLVASKLSPAPDGSGFRRDEVRAGCQASLARTSSRLKPLPSG